MALKTRYSPLVKFSLDNVFTAFTEAPVAKKIIALAVVGGLVALLLFLPLSLVSGKVSSLKKEISTSQKGYEQVADKIAEYQRSKAEAEGLEKKFGGAAVSLVPKIGGIAQQSGLTIEPPKPPKETETDFLTINSIEVSVKNVSLPQLVELLYNIEHDATPMRVRKLTVKAKPTSRQILDATFEVATFSVKKEM